jgi:hypothetical protein
VTPSMHLLLLDFDLGVSFLECESPVLGILSSRIHRSPSPHGRGWGGGGEERLDLQDFKPIWSWRAPPAAVFGKLWRPQRLPVFMPSRHMLVEWRPRIRANALVHFLLAEGRIGGSSSSPRRPVQGEASRRLAALLWKPSRTKWCVPGGGEANLWRRCLMRAKLQSTFLLWGPIRNMSRLACNFRFCLGLDVNCNVLT